MCRWKCKEAIRFNWIYKASYSSVRVLVGVQITRGRKGEDIG